MSGTLISDLDNVKGSDGDLVDSILSDMNVASAPPSSTPQYQANVAAPPPPMGARMPMQPVQPMVNNFPTAVDPAVPTAHMIGRDHPTQADFQRMMMMQQPQNQLPYNSMVPSMSSPMMMNPMMNQMMMQQPQKNSTAQWIDELKDPFIIVVITFLLSLNYLNIAAAKYVPNLLTPGGSFTTTGFLLKSLLAGFLYWFTKTFVGPMLNF